MSQQNQLAQLFMGGNTRNRTLSVRGADGLTWGASIVILLAVIQLVALGEYDKDFLSWISGFQIHADSKGTVMWALIKAALLAFIIATGKYARALIAVYALFILFTSYGSSVSFDVDKSILKSVDVNVSDMPVYAASVSPVTNTTDTAKPKSTSTSNIDKLIKARGLQRCLDFNSDMSAWCQLPSDKNPSKLNRDTDTGLINCAKGAVYKKVCK